jgi:hypothetical protein
MESKRVAAFEYGKPSTLILVFLLTAAFSIILLDEARAYELRFSTYFGGSGDVDQPRDIFVDTDGNIFISGGTNSQNLPTTPGAYDRTQNGSVDVFVAKFDATGQLTWCTYLGGPNYDRAYAIEVDNQGYVYLAGRAGPGFPVTPGAF